MKQLVLVAGHFTPSNLAAVHRARLWAQHLPELGWQPTVITTHHRHYEEALDWELNALVAADVRVIRTPAVPTRPVRWIGDIGVRALPFHYRAISRLARRGEIDFLHITVPSHYSALLGRMVHAAHGVPFGIDYIDPWVHEWPGTERHFSKAWTSARLGEALEPWAVRDAALITGVAPLYYEDVLERNPDLRGRAVTAAMPYGGSELDFEAVRRAPADNPIFDPEDGLFHAVYAGAMLPRAYAVLDRFFEAVAALRAREPEVARRLRLHFVGTGSSPSDPEGHNVRPYIERHSLQALADEHPMRVPYLQVLTMLTQASATLILGSTERHYTPSKAFQAVLARRPVLALLHRESTAARILEDARAATVVRLEADDLPDPQILADTLATFIRGRSYDPDAVDWQAFEQHSARASARALATALDQAIGAA
ncbi:MAG: hypothetical protein OXT09_21025 [Myxococcales bacterium]|nr:hypothetical protein [Myxococcales bacterium]